MKRIRSTALTVLLVMTSRCLAADAQQVLTVGRDPDAQFKTVQAAIDAAPEGAIVRIEAGTFEEQVTIRKPVILEGRGWEKTALVTVPPTLEEIQNAEKDFLARARALKTVEEREALAREFAKQSYKRGILVEGAREVEFRNIRFTSNPAVLPEGKSVEWLALADIKNGDATFDNCAFVGSPGTGLRISGNSTVEVRKSLIAAACIWIAVLEQPGAKTTATIADCDVRNCRYAGIVFRGGDVTVERCRISGAAWHGIRYDDASPTIADNRIFANARCGIYASGKTAARVIGNVFHANEIDGMSCWCENRDQIIGNTFVGNAREALSMVGPARPTVEHNVFSGEAVGVLRAGQEGEIQQPASDFANLSGNLFWKTPVELRWPDPHGKPDALGSRWADGQANEASKSVRVDPALAAPDYAPAADSPARRDGIGAANPPRAESPWPLQAEESAIIPDGPTRHWQKWKKPPPQKRSGTAGPA